MTKKNNFVHSLISFLTVHHNNITAKHLDV